MVIAMPKNTGSSNRFHMYVSDLESRIGSMMPLDEPLSREVRWVCDTGHTLDRSGRAMLPAVLPVVMGSVSDSVTFLAPQDRKLLRTQRLIQSKLSAWYPNTTHMVDLIAAESLPFDVPERGVGCFFSGGVDSLYSAISRHSEITHLIFVLGFDIPLSDKRICAQAVDDARATAKELGKELVVVRTTVRGLSNRYSRWGYEYHGAAIATVGLLLGRHIKHAIIPSSSPLENLHPWGTHPDLDYLWSTEYLHFEHHGQFRSRNEKLTAIADSGVDVGRLRVCWENLDGEYNCGRCEKCLRTMIPLYAIDRLSAFSSLPDSIDIGAIASMKLSGARLDYARDNLSMLLEHRGEGDPVFQALRDRVGAS